MTPATAVNGPKIPKLTRGMLRPSGISLKNKIIALTCISVLLSTLLVGGSNYFRIQKILLDTSVENLAGETRLMAQRFRFSYDQMKSDVQVLSQTSPIQGIVRSRANTNVDPWDGSSLLIWKDRLGTIFSSMMAMRPHYTQIRFIGIADRGRELVSANSAPSGIMLAPDEDMQQKWREPYFEAGLKTDTNDVFFSEVTKDREFDGLDDRLIPTVRAVIPVLGKDGKTFGMIVINANYGDMLRPAFEDIALPYDAFFLNSSGDYMEYRKNGTIGNFEFHDNYTVPLPLFVNRILLAKSSETVFVTDDAVSYFVRPDIDQGNPDAFMGVVVRVSLKELLARAYEFRSLSLLWGGLLILTCLATSLVLAHRFTAPLNKMTKEIKQSRGGEKLENLPVDRTDEIGDLARAFDHRTRELADQKAKLTAILDNTVDGFITVDECGKVETFNRSCERIFGYKAAEVIGRDVKKLMPAPYHAKYEGYRKRYQGAEECASIGIVSEFEGRRKDASIFPLDLSVSEVKIGDRKIYSGIVRDISERRLMETMKDEFISNVNHELRTPLTCIQGSLGLLMAASGRKNDEKSRKLLQLSYDNCQRLTRLVNDILDIEKIAAGKMDYQLEAADICQLVSDIIEQQISYAEKFGVTFKTDFDSAEILVSLDKDRFNQALVNLLSNAAKFSNPGGAVEIEIFLKNPSQVVISVRDHGSGIPSSFRGKIFSKFAQADGSATRMKGGSGLGLNITRKIIEAFDGTVDYESEEGKGSKFAFVLPVCSPMKMRA